MSGLIELCHQVDVANKRIHDLEQRNEELTDQLQAAHREIDVYKAFAAENYGVAVSQVQPIVQVPNGVTTPMAVRDTIRDLDDRLQYEFDSLSQAVNDSDNQPIFLSRINEVEDSIKAANRDDEKRVDENI